MPKRRLHCHVERNRLPSHSCMQRYGDNSKSFPEIGRNSSATLEMRKRLEGWVILMAFREVAALNSLTIVVAL
jgi:hypothetical protein